MAFYRNSYVPAFTSNDTYGNFYDASKVSLITVPDRLKNYDLDVKKAAVPTTASEYGDFLRGWQGADRGNIALGYPRLYRQQQELQQLGSEEPADRRHLPPPPEDAAPPQSRFHHLPLPPPPPPLPTHVAASDEAALLPEAVPPTAGFQYHREQQLSQLLPPATPPSPPPQPHQQPQQFAPPYRAPRARSPPPPIDISAYRSNPEVYTGRHQQLGLPFQSQVTQQQPPPPPPPLRLSGREVHLPNIEAVEVRMRDNSKMVLDVMDFYRRYLRD